MCPSFRHALSAHRASFPPGTPPAGHAAAPPLLLSDPTGGRESDHLRWHWQSAVAASRHTRLLPVCLAHPDVGLPPLGYEQQTLFLRMGWFPRLFTSQGTVGGAAGARTPNLRRARAALSQLSYDPDDQVGAPGLEPGTSALSGPRSNQLSYAPRRHCRPAHRCRHLRRRTSSLLPTMEKPHRSRRRSIRVTSGDSPAHERPCHPLHSTLRSGANRNWGPMARLHGHPA